MCGAIRTAFQKDTLLQEVQLTSQHWFCAYEYDRSEELSDLLQYDVKYFSVCAGQTKIVIVLKSKDPSHKSVASRMSLIGLHLHVLTLENIGDVYCGKMGCPVMGRGQPHEAVLPQCLLVRWEWTTSLQGQRLHIST